MQRLRITLHGKPYEVTVEFPDEGTSPAISSPQPVVPAAAMAAPAPAPVQPPATATAPAAVSGLEVRSPLSGKLVSLDVKPGQKVEEGSCLATIEAMKMNTYVFAPRDGTVSSLVAVPGEAVDEHAVLLVLE